MKSILFGCSVFLFQKFTYSNHPANQASLSLHERLLTFHKSFLVPYNFFPKRLQQAKGSTDIGAQACLELGQSHLLEKKYNEAIPYLKKSIELLEDNNTREGLLLLGNCQYAIGEAYFALGKNDEALERFQSSFDSMKNFGENGQKMLSKLYEKLGLTYTAKKEHKKALDYFTRTLEVQETQQAGNWAMVAETLNNISKAYFEMGFQAKSLEYYNKTIELIENNSQQRENEDHKIIKARVNLLPLQYALRKYQECEQNMNDVEKRLTSLQKNGNQLQGEVNEDLISMNFWKGGMKIALEQPEEAFQCYDAALDLALKHYGESHPKYKTLYKNVNLLHFAAGKKF